MNTNNSWKSNIMILENIIDETIEDEKLNDYKNEIKTNMNSLFQYYTNKRLDYNSYDDINKEILENITNLIVNLKEEKERKKEENSINKLHKNILVDNNLFNQSKYIEQNTIKYKKDDLIEERVNEFNNKLDFIRNDFNIHNQIKAPQVIDFSDKESTTNKNIDSLMEEEIKKRQYDTQQISTLNELEKKKAEAWFSNPNSKHILNQNPNDDIINREKEKITILDEPISLQNNNGNKINKDIFKKAMKKVTFEETNGENKIDNLLNKLKEERRNNISIKPEIEENTKIQSFNTIVESKVERNEKEMTSNDSIMNYFIINKDAFIEKEVSFIKRKLFISLKDYKIILLKIYENESLVHETELLKTHKEELKDFIYYKLLIPFNKNRKKYSFKLFDIENNELILSLNKRIKIDEIFYKNAIFLTNNEVLSELNNGKVILVKLKKDFQELNNFIDKKIFIDNEEIHEFVFAKINNINIYENETKKIDLNIENINKKNVFDSLLINEKYYEKLNETNELICKDLLYMQLL
jgi:hypothetical protein